MLFVHCYWACCCATVVVVATANCLVAFKSNYETRTHTRVPRRPVAAYSAPRTPCAAATAEAQPCKTASGKSGGNWENTPKGICACILINID